MISNNDIGNLGRLGNQMFQYASLRGIASNFGYSYCLPPEDYVGVKDPNCANSDVNIFQCFKLRPAPRLLTNFSTYTERYFHFDEWLWDNCPDSVNFWGYFQTEKYFKHIEDEIREDFTFVDEILEPCKKSFDESFGTNEVLSIHVRRCDYLKNPNHPTQSREYYENAINLFKKDIPVMVFSDEIEWCKEQPMFSGDRFIFSENNNTAIDLCLLSMCKYHIIANSSFSWWGSWLGKSKKTTAPKKWFGGSCINHNTEDLYCSGWIIL